MADDNKDDLDKLLDAYDERRSAQQSALEQQGAEDQLFADKFEELKGKIRQVFDEVTARLEPRGHKSLSG